MKYVLVLLALFYLTIAKGQTIKRLEVKGNIVSATNDVEAVTVFNTSSNQGTITDATGAFVIKVALNDVIEISALQFQAVTVTIDAKVINSKALKIQLVEQINQLDAVILTSGLSGILESDIKNVKIVTIQPIEVGNMNALIVEADKSLDRRVVQDHLQSIINPNARNYMPDLGKIIQMFLKPKAHKLATKKVENEDKKTPIKLLDVYSKNDVATLLGLSEQTVADFLFFVEREFIQPELLSPQNELLLLEFLIKQKEQFLKTQDAKN